MASERCGEGGERLQPVLLGERCLSFRGGGEERPAGNDLMQAEGQEPVVRQAEASVAVWRAARISLPLLLCLGLQGHEAHSRSSGGEGGTYILRSSGDTHEPPCRGQKYVEMGHREPRVCWYQGNFWHQLQGYLLSFFFFFKFVTLA